MPRVTRATVRSNALLEDATAAALTPLPLTPLKERVALGEITENQVREVPTTETAEEAQETRKMGPGKTGLDKAKRGKVAKKGKKQVPKVAEVNVEVLDDDNQSETSSAVEEACQDLIKGNSGEIHQTVIHDRRPCTPPSPAIFALRNVLSPTSQTPRFDPKIQEPEEIRMAIPVEEVKDNFTDAIVSRTPAKTVFTDGVADDLTKPPIEYGATPIKEDSIIALPQTKSPAKSVTRIEDSVEAIDAFEDEIEKVGELFPALKDESQIPAESTNQSKLFGEIAAKPTTGERKTFKDSKPAASMTNGAKAMRKGTNSDSVQNPATRSKQLATRKATAAPRVSRTSSIKITASSKTSPTFGPVKAPTSTHARVGSLHKAPFQPTRSSKPPTRPNFELPGEALSRKLKEQREERLQKEAEGEASKKTFKARPVRLSHAPIVKPTATSKARMSLAKADHVDVKVANNQAPTIKPIAPRQSMAPTDGNKRLSTLAIAKRVSARPANTSARSTRGPSLTAATTSRTTSMISRTSLLNTTGAPRALNAPLETSGTRQTSRGKEVFGRTRAELEAREKERKEKEEAARKARVEAAERGRLASRLWAERQKVKKMGLGTSVVGSEKGDAEEGKEEVVA